MIIIKNIFKELETSELAKMEGCGCYVLRSIEWKDGINRLKGRDNKNILYIGKADVLTKRVKSLKRAIKNNCNDDRDEPKEIGHKSLSRKFFRIRKMVKADQLFIQVFPIDASIPEVLESYLLESYVANYGELPPLNGQYGSHSRNAAITILKQHKLSIEDYEITKL